MPKVSVNLEDSPPPDANVEKVREMAASLPSVSRAKSNALKDAPRVQFSFTNVPRPIKDAFDLEAQRRGMTKKELLYECLRSGGIEIPGNTEIDGRRR